MDLCGGFVVSLLLLCSQVAAQSVCRSSEVDLVFIMDSSTSVGDINFSKMLKFVADLVEDADTLSGNVRVGVLTYSTSTHTHIALDNQLSKEELLESIVNIPYVQGSTNTADALLTMRTKMFRAQGDRGYVRNVAVLITDGISDHKSKNTIPEANNARAQGIEIFAVGITLTDTWEIECIAVKFENRFLANTFDELNDVFGELFLSLCVASFAGPESVVYLLPECGRSLYDVVFLLDSSGSFSKASDLISYMDIDSGAVRVGLITFGYYANVQFYLNGYQTKAEVLQAVQSVMYTQGGSNTFDAIRLMHEMVFSENYGDRKNIPNIAVFLTDGTSANTEQTIAAAARAKMDGIRIFGLGVTLSDITEMDAVVSEPVLEHSFQAASFDELDQIRDILFIQTCSYAEASRSQQLLASDKIDLIFLLHFSDNVDQDRFNLLLSFIKNLLQNAALDSGEIRVGAAVYGYYCEVLFNLTQYGTRADLMSGIDKIPFFSSWYSNAAEGFRVVRDQMFTTDSGDRPDAPNIVIMITDSSADNPGESAIAAGSVRKNGIHIFGVGVGLSDPDELEIYVSLGDANTFMASGYRGLDAIRPEIIQKVFALQDEPVLPERIQDPITSTLPFEDQYKADIAFVVHASNKVNYKNFRIYLDFLRQLINEMDIESGAIRLALVTYGKTANAAFYLNSHTVRPNIQKGIRRLPRKIRSGKADLTKAFQLLRTDVFTEARGDRPDAANGIFLFTDMSTTDDINAVLQEARALDAGGARIFAMGIGSADGQELRQITLDASGQSVYSANNYQGLNRLVPILRSRILPCKAISCALGHRFIQSTAFVVI